MAETHMKARNGRRAWLTLTLKLPSMPSHGNAACAPYAEKRVPMERQFAVWFVRPAANQFLARWSVSCANLPVSNLTERRTGILLMTGGAPAPAPSAKSPPHRKLRGAHSPHAVSTAYTMEKVRPWKSCFSPSWLFPSVSAIISTSPLLVATAPFVTA